MKELLRKLWGKKESGTSKTTALTDQDLVRRQVKALFDLLRDLHGQQGLALQAEKYQASQLMHSSYFKDQLLALERIIRKDGSWRREYQGEEISIILDELENRLADLIARRSIEEDIEKKVNEKVQERHQEYVRELRAEVMREEAGPDNAYTLKKYAALEVLEQRNLSRSAIEMMRPKSLDQVIGQRHAIRTLLSILSSPFPQHIIIYGPPGVGKTTVARLALEEAKKREHTPFTGKVPFVEVDGSTLRWDPRDVTNPLLGSVHDPVYQGARRDLADCAVPEPKLGLVTEAHGGVLFIDEIGEVDPILQNKLLKVLEDKRVLFDSSYYDPDDPKVPLYIRKLFSEGAPADFVLIGATTREPSQINPALRSRCAEIFFDPLTPADIKIIIENAATRLEAELEPPVAAMIADYTIEGRKAVRLLADAYSVALYRCSEEDCCEGVTIKTGDLLEVIHSSRLTPYAVRKGSERAEVGRVFGMATSGYLGAVLEIEAVAYKAAAPGKGMVRFNETAGSMAKDSVFNAASVFRGITGEELSNYDVHINVIGGGKVDGPSAGAAILLAIISAVFRLPIAQNVSITGELSLQGKLKAIGGLHNKLYGARQAGMKKVFIPQENWREAAIEEQEMEIIPVETVYQLLELLFPGRFQSRNVYSRSSISG